MDPEPLQELNRQADALERMAEAQELQNALLLQLVHELERGRAERRDPHETSPSDASVATDVIDKYHDLYGVRFGEWEFDPIARRVSGMGDRGD